MQKSSPKPSPLILILLVSFATVNAVLFTPGLPSIALKFKISASEAQLPVSIFLIGYALGQLPWGPLANRFGRKPSLYSGVALQILGATFTGIFGFTSSYFLFLFFIFITALGSSVGLKMSFTMISDSFSLKEVRNYIAYLDLSFAMAPGLGVAIGGYLVRFFNWQSCFFFLAIYGCFFLFLTSFLPETGEEIDRRALEIKKIAYGYWNELKNTLLILCGIIWGCGIAFIYLFAERGPFIAINQIGLNSSQYGLFNLIPALGLISGSLSSRLLIERIKPFQMMSFGIICSCSSVLIQFFCFLFGFVNLWSLFFPMIFIYFGSSVLFINVSAIGLTNAKNKANASAIINFLSTGLAVLATLMATILPTKKAVELSIFFIPLSGVIILALIGLVKQVKKLSQNEK